MDTPNFTDYPLEHTNISRVALLTNPKAGKGGATRAANTARTTLTRHGVDVVGISGADAEASLKLAHEMISDSSINALVVCGGDGLINLALQAHANSKVPLGIIPAGTGNDHARALSIPLDARRAAMTIVRGFTTTCDLGKITSSEGEERYFGTIACAGFDSLVSDRTNTLAWPTGRARYNLAIAIEFARFHSIPTRIIFEDAQGETFDEDATLCAFGNTTTYGGGMRVCPQADHHDGLLDVTVLKKLSRRKAVVKVGRFFAGDFDGQDEVNTYRTAKATIHMPGINVYADGDLMFPSPTTIECVPAAGRFIVPRP